MTTLYFAPTYFSTSYFPGTTPSPGVSELGYGDLDAYAAILDLLRQTGAFEDVLFAPPLGREPASFATSPVVAVVPLGWEEFDDVDPSAILRRVSFALDLFVRDDDPPARFGRLDALERVVRAAIDGAGLGGCLPALTQLRRGQYDARSLHPEQAARLNGEFSYMVGADPSPAPTP